MAQPSVRNSLTRTSLFLIAVFVTLEFVVPATSAAAPGRPGRQDHRHLREPSATGDPRGRRRRELRRPGRGNSVQDPDTGLITYYMYCTTDPLERRGRRRRREPDLPPDPDDDLDRPGQLDLRRRRVPAGHRRAAQLGRGGRRPLGARGRLLHDLRPVLHVRASSSPTRPLRSVASRELHRRQRDRRRRERQPDRPVGVLRRARRGPDATATTAPETCDFLWTFDPDVIGDSTPDVNAIATTELPLLRQLLRRRVRRPP